MTVPQPQEVVIGTDDCTNAAAWQDDEFLSQSPALAEVEEYVASLLALVTNGGVTIESSAIHLIENIVDKLDQVYYWAFEEGSTFLHKPSVLAQCEVPHLVVLCIKTKRPKIMVAALRIMRHLLHHEQAGAHLFAVAAAAVTEEVNSENKGGGEDDNGDTAVASNGKLFCRMLADAMEQCAGLAQLQAEAAAVASEAARLDIEGVLESAVISHTLAALQRHSENTAMQLEGLRLFRTLVDIQRGATGTGDVDAVQLTPTAVLFSHVGVVVSFVLSAARAHTDNLDVKHNAIHFFCRCVSYRENVLVLLQHGVYPFLLAALPSATNFPKLFVELTEAIAAFAPLLDPLQRRSLVLTVRRVLLKTTSTLFLSLCVALLVRVLLVASGGEAVLPREGGAQMTETPEPAPASPKRLELLLSERIALADDDTRTFMSNNWIPQLLCHAADTFGDDDATLQRTLKEAIQLFSHSKWR